MAIELKAQFTIDNKGGSEAAPSSQERIKATEATASLAEAMNKWTKPHKSPQSLAPVTHHLTTHPSCRQRTTEWRCMRGPVTRNAAFAVAPIIELSTVTPLMVGSTERWL